MILTEQELLQREDYLSWIEVDLQAVRENFRTIRQRVRSDTDIFPVVKADAYGHGAVEVCQTLQSEGATRFCVARVEDAIDLRQGGIQSRILVLAPPLGPQAVLAARHDLEVLVCAREHLDAIQTAQNAGFGSVQVHLKIDIGMGRLGIPPGESIAFLEMCDLMGIQVIGIMSHLPCADFCDDNATLPFVKKFTELKSKLVDSNRSSLIFHTANSAATLRYPESYFDAVRCGVTLYGQYPAMRLRDAVPLKPAMSLFSRIIYIKDVPSGTPLSYCHTYYTQRPSRIATVAIGYADGYPRHASNNASLVLHGVRVPQVGRVCMDQLLIDITNVPHARIGDPVMAFGVNNGVELRAEELAESFDSNGYEITSRIGKRLPRFYR